MPMNKKTMQIGKIGMLALMCSALFFAARSSAQWDQNTISASMGNLAIGGCYYTDLYLYHDYDADTLSDYGLYLNTNLKVNGNVTHGYEAWQISQPYSNVRVQSPLPNMIYKIFSGQSGDGTISAIDNNTFWRASRVFPYNTPVRLFATVPNLITFEEPSDADITKNAVSIQYNYAYRSAIGIDMTQTLNYRYNTVPDINYYGNALTNFFTGSSRGGTYQNHKRTWGGTSTPTTASSCRTFDLHRCGDGSIDSTTGTMISGGTNTAIAFYDTGFEAELCDDGPLNGTLGYCDLNCGRGGAPVCGNSIVDTDEDCDAGVLNGTDVCGIDCMQVSDVAVDEAVNE